MKPLHTLALSALATALLIPAEASAQETFMRGDVNLNGVIDEGDANQLVDSIYFQGPLLCEDAGDYNDDGTLNVADVISILNRLNSGGAPPPAPFPTAGVDPTADSLSCEVSLPGDSMLKVVNREPEVLDRFSFERVVQTIIDTSNNNVSVTPTSFYQVHWWAFWATHCNDPLPNSSFPQSCSEAERGLGDNDPFAETGGINPDSYEPVALFNRFDLAPADGSHCGEQRIVFGKVSGQTDPLDRNMLIFEAQLPNPLPAQGLAGCRAIAEQWDMARAASPTGRADLLEELFFDGLDVAHGVRLPPALHADHFRPGAGQVRSNMLQGEPTWTLREFQLTDCDELPHICVEYLRQRVLPSAPAPELFAGNDIGFMMALLDWIPALASDPFTPLDIPEQYRAPSNPIVATQDFNQVASTTMRSVIDSYLATEQIPLTSTDVLNRATHQTCAGCHQLQSGADLGDGVTAPFSLGFLHVNEHGVLSHGLMSRFLPEREQMMDDYLASLP